VEGEVAVEVDVLVVDMVEVEVVTALEKVVTLTVETE
jgi:hypothetical protein